MDWTAAQVWWILCGLLVAGELATGTFYLLMLAIGVPAAALAAQAGASLLAQVALAAVVGGGAVALLHRYRRRHPRPLAPERNPDLNLDIGETIQVDAWNAGGTTRAVYRGSGWNVRYVGADTPAPGPHVIVEVRHNELAVRPVH